MLRNGGLGYSELRPDDLRDRARRLLAVGKQLEDPPSNRVSQHVERMHDGDYIIPTLYKSSLFLRNDGDRVHLDQEVGIRQGLDERGRNERRVRWSVSPELLECPKARFH